MYEPYVPPGESSGEVPACACSQRRLICTPACQRCPADCPDRVAVETTGAPAEQVAPQADPPYEPYDATPDAAPPTSSSSSSSSSSWSSSSSRRRRRGSSTGGSSWRRGSSSRASGSTSRSSSGSSSGSSRKSSGKKAGAGIGAAATAAAGGIGALSSGGEDPGTSPPDPGYPEYSSHSDYTDYYGYSSDPYGSSDPSAVVDDVPVPIVSFTAQRGGRLVVVTGTWPASDLSGGCRVEVTATERSGRVLLEAVAPVTRRQSQEGEYCDPPANWSTATSYVQLDEPLGKRAVVTTGPLLRAGEEVDAAGTVRVPRG